MKALWEAILNLDDWVASQVISAIVILSVLLMVLAASLSAPIVYAFGSATCSARWAPLFETRFNLLEGCRVKTKDGWVPEDKVRVFVKEVGA